MNTLNPHEHALPTEGTAQDNGLEIAVVGLAGRFPGAPNVEVFWQNLAAGVESIGPLDEAWLRAQGLDESTLNDPGYRKVGAPLAGSDLFDAGFFGYSPREAELLDPQQRVFLECAWEALENAGCDARRYPGAIGLFGGAGMNGYLFNLYGHSHTRASVSPYEIFIANDKDFLTTRVSYKLDLRGPSVAVQTACSSSLVAVHLACQSLLGGECEMALAGGVALSRQVGYRPQEGGIYSPDGHCRAFDAAAAGTVGGNGVGIVVLKRLADALADGDTIHAVIKGSAINNDGAHKVSFTAPSVDRQAAVIEAALAAAEVPADSIAYVEAHGTGTRLGDPIEVAALTRAFRRHTARSGFCALGSVKTNIGHLDAAAGIASLIKTILALRHRQIPPSLHFEQPNPAIDFEASPFRVNASLADWPATLGQARRAGVSSFGIGGTNAHVVLEEAPVAHLVHASSPSVDDDHAAAEAPQLLLLSARTPGALAAACARLADHLDAHPAQPLGDVAHTLREGRREFEHRRHVLARGRPDAITQLRAAAAAGPISPAAATLAARPTPSPVWLLSGQGSQHAGMGALLYRTQPVFRAALDECAALLDAELPTPLVTLVCGDAVAAGASLDDTAQTQPALFAFEYALARVWQSAGLQPRALLGHSLGELVAACLAGVFELPVALRLVLLRARAMQSMPRGAMLAVAAEATALSPYLDRHLTLAAVNAPAASVVSGSVDGIEGLADELAARGIACQRLRTSHAFHSPSMDEATTIFATQAARLLTEAPAQAPRIPFISNVSGTWITAQEAVDPAYWARQLRATVQFHDGLQRVLELPDPVLLEIGPGQVLCGLVRQHLAARPSASASPVVVPSWPSRPDGPAHASALLDAAGQLWRAGLPLVWRGLAAPGRRVPLPTYPFERQRYWIDADAAASRVASTSASTAAPASFAAGAPAASSNLIADRPDPADWIYAPGWQRQLAVAAPAVPGRTRTWLILGGQTGGLAEHLARRIESAGDNAFTAVHAASLAQQSFRSFGFDALVADQWQALRADLAERDLSPSHIVDLRALDTSPHEPAEAHVARGLALINAWARGDQAAQIVFATRSACDVLGHEALQAEQAALQGLAMVAGQEHPLLGARVVDLDAAPANSSDNAALAKLLWDELCAAQPPALVAWRSRHRWAATLEALSLPAPAARRSNQSPGLRRQGHYVIAGDLAQGVGALWARQLAANGAGRLTLISACLPAAAVSSALVSACEAHGATVVALQADPFDGESLSAAFEQAALDTVIHGVFLSLPTTNARSAAPLSMLTPEHWAYNQHTRLTLLNHLVPLVERHAPAFCCVQSSMASVLGGIGLAAYGAAHQVLDTVVAEQARHSRVAWIAIHWDPTEDTELPPENGARARLPANGVGAALQAHALSADEVWTLTERVLAAGLTGKVSVSRADLHARRAQWLHAQPQLPAESTPERPTHGRPPLATPYVAPSNEVERTIAALWQELLRIDEVGVNDSFFDLGGHSLLAIQAIGRLRQAFPVTLELRDLLDGTPTVAGIAERIAPQLPQAEELDLMASLLAEVQALSADEVQAELSGPAT